jgi:hypothetical protein
MGFHGQPRLMIFGMSTSETRVSIFCFLSFFFFRLKKKKEKKKKKKRKKWGLAKKTHKNLASAMKPLVFLIKYHEKKNRKRVNRFKETEKKKERKKEKNRDNFTFFFFFFF